jgi:hypothetical protein
MKSKKGSKKEVGKLMQAEILLSLKEFQKDIFDKIK